MSLEAAPVVEPLLRAQGLAKRFPLVRGLLGARGEVLPALRGVTFEIARGQTLGFVGESGSGKTTAGRIVARLVRPDSGRILFDGTDWLAVSGAALRRRWRELQVVFQDPQSSLNPSMRAGDQIAEPLRVQGLARGRALRERVGQLLADVGLGAETASRFPSELSGGQRQRVAIARALATSPRLVVCDEPVSALDVSVGAQIVNLLLDLRERAGLSYLFISHDLAVVSRMADRIAVFYLGAIVEEGPSLAICARPLHPYTFALVAAAAEADPSFLRRGAVLPGELPSAVNPPSGCHFHPRCPIARPRCRQEAPGLSEAASGHRVSCFYPGEMG
jgi:oligopeptide/dipeptide ABC transporter ATP-binding protein